MRPPPAGEALLCERGAEVVHQLRRVQDALGTGYLSAFPIEHFDRLEALQPVWAPYYVVPPSAPPQWSPWAARAQWLPGSTVLSAALKLMGGRGGSITAHEGR